MSLVGVLFNSTTNSSAFEYHASCDSTTHHAMVGVASVKFVYGQLPKAHFKFHDAPDLLENPRKNIHRTVLIFVQRKEKRQPIVLYL
eukprot:2914904-Amphidinium_carterae.1